MGCNVGICSPVVLHRLEGDRSSPWAAVESLLLHLDHFLPLLFLCRGCLQGCFSYIFLTPLLQLLHSVFYFILDILSQKQP